MKRAYGWALPDSDLEFEPYLARAPQVLGRHVYQGPHIQATLGATRSRRVAVDAGAHVGFWSFYLAKYFAEVHAFEPVAELAACFRENVRDAHVVLHEVALGKKKGFVEMAATADNTGMSHVRAAGSGSTPIEKLDSFELTDVDLIKIDVEGYEKFVLEGARRTILRCKPVIVLEQKPHAERYAVGRYDAVGYLQHMGAQVLNRVVDDFILAWP